MADGSEEPVSEFLFEKFLHCDLLNHTSTMTIAKNIASTPAAPPTIAAFDFDMSQSLLVYHKRSEMGPEMQENPKIINFFKEMKLVFVENTNKERTDKNWIHYSISAETL